MVARLFLRSARRRHLSLWSPARPPASERSVHGNDAQARSTRSGICDCVRVPRSPKWNWCASPPWSPKCARNIASFFWRNVIGPGHPKSCCFQPPHLCEPDPGEVLRNAKFRFGPIRHNTPQTDPASCQMDGSAEETRLGAPSAAGRPTQAGPTNSAVRWLHRGRGGLPRARRLSAVRDSRRSCSRR